MSSENVNLKFLKAQKTIKGFDEITIKAPAFVRLSYRNFSRNTQALNV